MIKFKQKEFVAPLVGAALSMAPDLVNAGINAVQNNQQNKAQQEALEQQKKQQEQQNKLLNKIAKKDPGAAANVMAQQNQPQQQQFSVKTYIKDLKTKYKDQAKKALNDLTSVNINKDDVKGFGKDVKHALWKNKGILTAGALVTAAGTVGNKAGRGIVKYLENRDTKKEAEEREYSVISDFLKRGARHVGNVAKENKGRIAQSALISAALPVAGYYLQKRMKRNMAEDLEGEEREFSIKGKAKRLAVGVRKYYRDVKSDPLKKIIEFKSPVSTKKLTRISEDLNEGKSGSRITKLVSDTVKNHPKTAMLIGASTVYLGNKTKNKIQDTIQKGIDKIKNKKSSSNDYYEIED